jgi:hypothetical protein
MWWLSWWDVVAQLVGMWWLSLGDVVAQLAKARLDEPDCNAAVPGSISASSTVGWVDIGTRARVPLRFVVYLKKSMGNEKNWFFQVTTSALVRVILYSRVG